MLKSWNWCFQTFHDKCTHCATPLLPNTALLCTGAAQESFKKWEMQNSILSTYLATSSAPAPGGMLPGHWNQAHYSASSQWSSKCVIAVFLSFCFFVFLFFCFLFFCLFVFLSFCFFVFLFFCFFVFLFFCFFVFLSFCLFVGQVLSSGFDYEVAGRSKEAPLLFSRLGTPSLKRGKFSSWQL